MFSTFISMFKNKNVRERIVYTLGIFLIFKLGASITIPMVDVSQLQLGTQDMLSLMNIMGGGSLQQFSVFAMGVSPYITSSIVIQLLAAGVLPALSDLNEQGEQGKKTMENATRALTLMLGAVQAYGIIVTALNYGMTINGSTTIETWDAIFIITLLMAGTLFLMWLGDQITTKGVGNGMSMIIFSGIIASVPMQFIAAFGLFVNDTSTVAATFTGLIKFTAYVLCFLVLIIFVVYMEQAQRKVPIQYSNASKSVRSQSDVTFLPMKVNSAGVIPIIFASSVMSAPSTFVALVDGNKEGWFLQLLNLTAPYKGWYWGLTIFVILVILFTFFYARMQVDPEKISENFSKSGAYIPGIKPGKETARYLSMILNRVTFIGAAFITIIGVLPFIVQIVLNNIYPTASQTLAAGFGGTGIIIIVGVALETVKEIEGRMAGKDYSGFSAELD